jgi:hypothetical protein
MRATRRRQAQPAQTREAPRVVSSRLSGRQLALARTVWLTVAGLTVALFVAGVRAQIGQLRGPCPLSTCVNGHVPSTVAHAFATLHLSVRFYGGYELGRNVLFAVGYAAAAALLFWRRSYDPLTLFVALTLVLFGIGSFDHGLLVAALAIIGPGWQLPVTFLGFLGELAFGFFVVIFPDGRFVPRWLLLAAPVLMAIWWVPEAFFPGSPLDYTTWPGPAYFAGWVVILGAMGAFQVYRYQRISTPAQQFQTKWVVYGFVAAGIGYFGSRIILYVFAPAALTSRSAILADLTGYTLAYASMLAIPVCIAIAILRHRLYDIDIIIRRTLVYSIVTGILALVYLGSIVGTQAVVQAIWGPQPLPAVVVATSTLLIAALFQPLRSRVQAIVDRRFYRRAYDAAQTVETFGRTLRNDVDLDHVTEHLLAVVGATMQPSQVSLWLVQPHPQGEMEVSS